MPQLYIIVAVLVLAVIAIMAIYTKKGPKPKGASMLSKLSFLLVITGIFFGENRILAYSLIVSGLILALIDIQKKAKDKVR